MGSKTQELDFRPGRATEGGVAPFTHLAARDEPV